MAIRFTNKGDFSKTERYFKSLTDSTKMIDFDRFGKEGVAALSSMTPTDTGKTAKSWYYEITKKKGFVRISFNNSNIQNGVPIAIILQYGHGTKNGGWVEGKDYINPSIQPIFDEITNNAWREVTKR